jgi:hypothetical protein
MRRNPSNSAVQTLYQGLGWFSILLGAAEVIRPGGLGRMLGMENARLLQAYGLREILAGLGILGARNPSTWLWSRVAGDVLDLATLASGLRHQNRQRGNVGVALAAVAAVTLIDIYCARRMSPSASRPLRDYSDRGGFPERPERMRAAAAGD